MEQGTDEWLEWRKKKIGASDAPIVLGISPYKTAYDLWMEKTGRKDPPPMNSAMKRGHDMEETLRQSYEEIFGEPFMPKVIEHPTIPWMIASLDGVNLSDSIILEIKTCKREVIEEAANGRVPPYHFAQGQHQLACLPSAREVHFFYYNQDKTQEVVVKRDEEYIQDLTHKLHEFYDHILHDTPPPMTEEDIICLDDDEDCRNAAHELREAKLVLDMAKKSYEEKKQTFLDCGDDGNFQCNGVVAKRESRSTIDYKKACEDVGIDLKNYKKPAVGFWKINFTQEKS